MLLKYRSNIVVNAATEMTAICCCFSRLFLLLLVIPDAFSLLSQKWRNIKRTRSHYRPYNMNTHNRIQELLKEQLDLCLTVSGDRVQLFMEGHLVYDRTGEAATQKHPGGKLSGVHLLVLHPRQGHLMLAKHFLTYQPTEHSALTRILATIQPGRIIVLIGVPEWVMFLGADAEKVLLELGSLWVSRVVQGEAWSWIGVSGGTTLAELVTTRHRDYYPASSFSLETFVPKAPLGQRCPWYSLPGLRRQATFCERYEGYGRLCDCHRPFFPEARKLQTMLATHEEIPVVVVTAYKPQVLFRLLQNLFTVPGAAETPIIVVVDGTHVETLALIETMQLKAFVHRPEGKANERINSNIKFAVQTVFRHFPRVDKAIFLEDDLLLSPDILRFFHDTAQVLDRDPTVYCVNAYSSNSFSDTAQDTSVLLRARSYPMYGWMVKRSYADQIVHKWVKGGEGDWDWWLAWEDQRQGRDVVFPEVSRTFHSGSAGTHVSGFEQAVYFNRMVYNLDPGARVLNVNLVVRDEYNARLRHDLEMAKVLIPPHDICGMTWVPVRSSRPIAVFVYAEDENDKFYSYRIFLLCMKTYDESTREIYQGVIRLHWHGTVFYVVGCPASPFCHHNLARKVYKPPSMDLQRAFAWRDDWEATLYQMNPHTHRDAHMPLPRIFDLTNIVDYNSTVSI